MPRPHWLLFVLLLVGGCSLLPKAALLSPSMDGDVKVGYNPETKVDNTVVADEGPAGGIVGKIGGGDDSVSLWIAIVILGVIAFSAYPAQRTARLAWNSWRGSNGKPRKGKGKETCIKVSEWDLRS